MTNAQSEKTKAGTIYVFESDGNGFNTKTTFFDDGKEVVAFDAQFTVQTAEQAIKFLKSKTNSPIKYLVVTHPNPDKFNGIPAFQKEGAKVIMSELSAQNLKGVHEYKKYYFVQMAKMFTEDSYPKLPTADITYRDNYSIQLANGGVVELKELGKSGISTNQTVAFIKSVNVIVVGDLVHHKAHAWLEGPIVSGQATYITENWVNVLAQIQKEYPDETLVYGGRGEAGKLSVAIPLQIAYLQKAELMAKQYINSLDGATFEDKKAKVDYSQLQKVFEKEFPNYTLGYMIGYGSYGLVGSLK